MITVCFTGHRPDKLGGYDWNTEINFKIIKALGRKIEDVLLIEGARTFIFGGALGIDQMAFELVYQKNYDFHDIKMIMAVPFQNQAIKWFNKKDVDRYVSQLKRANEIVFVDTLPQYRCNLAPLGEYHPVKMQKRNEYMVDNSDIVIAVWDGSKGGTGNCVKYAQSKGKNIIRINPKEI